MSKFRGVLYFKENLNLQSTTTHDTSFLNCIFEKDFLVNNSDFKGNVRFYSTKFRGNTDFYNTKFEKLADFWNAKFYKKTIFNKTDFLGTTVFSATTFKENVLFTYSLINKLAIFRGANFEKGLDLSLALISGDMTLFDINIKDFEAVNDTNDAVIFSEYVTEKGLITRKNKRETFRIIKYRLIQNQSSIDALIFAKLEMKAYKEELKKQKFEISKIGQIKLMNFIKNEVNPYIINKENRLLLWFNGISNNHNNSWIKGVLFTLTIAGLFTYLSIISTENYVIGFRNIGNINYENCIKYFITALLPTHSIDYLDNENPTGWFYIFDFLGRIFISYGIYQTIQAFRKYKIR